MVLVPKGTTRRRRPSAHHHGHLLVEVDAVDRQARQLGQTHASVREQAQDGVVTAVDDSLPLVLANNCSARYRTDAVDADLSSIRCVMKSAT